MDEVSFESVAFDFENQFLAKAFESLSEQRKQIVEMIFIEGLKSAEAAKLRNYPINEVYQEKYQALKKLKRILERVEQDEI